MDPAYKETHVENREHYAPTAAPITGQSGICGQSGSPAGDSPAADEAAAAREKARISQAREIAALRREIEFEINSHNF